MAGTHTRLLYHFVFSTKHRQPLITHDIESRLHEYMGGIVRSMSGVAIRVGGAVDHARLLVRWRTDETIAALMRTVKARSSAWVHDTFPALRAFAWQEGYAAFTVSQSQVAVVDEYIGRQAEHHRKRTFQEELVEFLRAHEIEYDERYIWK
jgi:REP element-mobilizing transposase RayT